VTNVPRFCISDLHACDRGYRDNFAVEGRESRFNAFLDFVESQDGGLYVLGDLLDFWQVNLSKSIMAYIRLLDRLDAMEAVYVVGNHDGALSHFIDTPLMMPGHSFFTRMRHAFEEEIGGRRFTFLHGHESDPYCRDDNPGTGEITAIISGMLEDRNRSPFDRHHRAVEDQFVGTLEGALTFWRKLTFQHGRLDEMLEGVEKYRAERKADVVVYGHTHEPGRIGEYHFNTGSWARANDTFVWIEDDGQVGVWEWLGNRPVPYGKVLRDVPI
jgi:UDP-2,3-diacylglucosamine pyrophosphatase LpxH